VQKAVAQGCAPGTRMILCARQPRTNGCAIMPVCIFGGVRNRRRSGATSPADGATAAGDPRRLASTRSSKHGAALGWRCSVIMRTRWRCGSTTTSIASAVYSATTTWSLSGPSLKIAGQKRGHVYRPRFCRGVVRRSSQPAILMGVRLRPHPSRGDPRPSAECSIATTATGSKAAPAMVEHFDGRPRNRALGRAARPCRMSLCRVPFKELAAGPEA